jgi:uncharacterized protein involved in exopolysaccharide biosynthesis
MPNRTSKSDQALLDQFEGERLYLDRDEEKANREKTYARLQLLWEERRFLGKALLYGLAICLAVAFLIPTEYEATTQLMPPDQQSGSGLSAISSLAGGSGGALKALAGMLGGSKTSGDLFVGVIGSETVEDDLITKFDLRKVYGKKRWEDARKKLDSRTDASVDKKSEILKISVTDRSAQRATAMAQEYVDELNRLLAQLNTSASHRERVFLEARLQEVKQALESSEQQFSQFASANTALDIPEQGKAMIAASSQLQGQLIAAQTELQGLRQIYTDNNVRVKETQARIDELQRQLGNMRGDSGPADGATPQDGSDALGYPSIRKLPQLGVTYADLMRSTKVNEAVYETLTEQYEAAKVDEAKDLPTVKVLDPAQVPEKKSFPPRAIITIVGGLLFLGFGILWVLWREHWKNIDPQDPAKSLATRVGRDLARDLPWLRRNGRPAAWQARNDAPDAGAINGTPGSIAGSTGNTNS